MFIPEGVREKNQSYSDAPDRRNPGERGHKIATLTADDCYGKKMFTHQQRDGENGRWAERNNVTQISPPLGSELPAPASADSLHPRDEPEPDGLRGSAWRSPP